MGERRQQRIQAVKDDPEKAAEYLEVIAVLCGNHRRRGSDSPGSLISMANGVLRMEGRIRKLLTGDKSGEIRG